ncbi:tRNA uridine-5-carboxymethylaminomethyl(34) synthesis GTPase MnmE [Sphingomonas desiccabilis]|uniref:tRNA modification GTPase MnmE n=1 Tax=Sphingomonas desiccabilis TaxID=429134 RepID=A0A4Q2IQI5_9SPHN|nr:tRNA uridine-5-carboxymethylaminomethyl(34) synthesis GTPase MnmE [Sphingomonas desiccabilis]MBB3912187.1 tRNA modification GTPase [Sphingomonas desiccabilis]RXZ30347.1 tRNA uridine-5-carboxymethylaminomethyl(34) synthesis GTPase MnmE [Sphingomonas desiccabilis]
MDTIFAVSSGQPPAAIALLRVSGPGAVAAAEALAGELPPPRRAGLRALRDPADGGLLDRALLLWFPAPHTATGEDLVELHLHGGRAVVRAVEACLARQPRLRPAEAGEFTRRALANGRLDLSEAEGLGDLLMAETEAQRRAALATAEGAVRRQVEGWQDRLLMLAAHVEAMLDHADEEDVADDFGALENIRSGCEALGAELAEVLAAPPVERLRDGIRVVLAGPPNSGKSTLLNALADREAAIVSPIAGTTRDRIEAPVVRNGIAWVLTDTAGLAENTDDPIERIGIARAEEAMQRADLLLWLADDPAPEIEGVQVLALHPRADLPGRGAVPSDRIGLSVAQGWGIVELWSEMERMARGLLPREDMLALNRRQQDLLHDAACALADAAAHHDPLLIAEELRRARAAFDRVTGRADVEGVLDALFGRFCIGK